MLVILFRNTGTIEVFDNYTVVSIDDDAKVKDLPAIDDWIAAMEADDPNLRMEQVVANGAIVWKRGDGRPADWANDSIAASHRD